MMNGGRESSRLWRRLILDGFMWEDGGDSIVYSGDVLEVIVKEIFKAPEVGGWLMGFSEFSGI